MNKEKKLVTKILRDVARSGDQALRDYTKKFDGYAVGRLEVSPQEWQQAVRQVSKREASILQLAADRIRRFHEQQVRKSAPRSWEERRGGVTVGQRVSPLERIGIYVPGGRAAYPSTVLMNALPARVAGVKEILMVTPAPGGQVNRYALFAAKLAGVDRVFKVGGAQAIAALAYGTKSIPRVDKIVGPGNIFVALAKAEVAAAGLVGIDSFAGPTEVVIIADAQATPEFVAADLLSQAEHDPEARAVLITPSEALIRKVKVELKQQLATLARKEIAGRSLKKNGDFILVKNLTEACQRSNKIAPEHLELMVGRPRSLLKNIRNAGAIFLGGMSPVALGDYLAGPNHVLPTAGTARFSSPLGVNDFLKTSSVIEASAQGLSALAPAIDGLATLEGLTAHAKSVTVRASK